MPEIINARLDKRNFEHLVRQMHDKAIDPKPVLAAIGNLAVKSIRQNFINGGRPNAWAKSKKTKGKTMIGTGALMKGIHYTVDEDGTTVMTSKLPYAHILHFGGTTKPHEIKAKNRRALLFNGIFRTSVNHPGSKIPARPYMILQDEDIQKKNFRMTHFFFPASMDSNTKQKIWMFLPKTFNRCSKKS